MSLSGIELEEECLRLKLQIEGVKEELELKNQQVHDHKKNISLATVLQEEYEQEIEILQSNKNSVKLRVQNEIKQIEESISNLQTKHNAELVKKSEIITNLRKEVQERKWLVNKKDSFNQLEVTKAKNRIVELKTQFNYLNENLLDSEKSIESLSSENTQLQQEISELQNEFSTKKECLNKKSTDLTNMQTLIQKLQDEIVGTKLELDSLKSKPLDPSQKGNSMFSEVEDSRMKLQQKIQQVRKMSANLQQEQSNKLKSMKLLCMKSLELCKFVDEVEDCNNFQAEIDSILAKIKALESTVTEYAKEFNKEIIFSIDDLPSGVAAFGNITINELCKNSMEAGWSLDSISKNTIHLILQIQAAIKELIKNKRKNLKLKVEISNLECNQLENQMQDNATNCKSLVNATQHRAIKTEFVAFRKPSFKKESS